MMNNHDIARIFDQIGNLLEIRGDEGFRVNAYRRAAREIEGAPVQVTELAARGALETLPGIGKGTAAKIEELLRTGRIALFDELAAQVPVSLLDLLTIPTLGPKRIAVLWRELGVRSIEDLKAAIATDAVRKLKGFGARSIEQIRRGIEFREKVGTRIRLDAGVALAAFVMEELRRRVSPRRLEVAGSLRRGRETLGDMDLLCSAADGGATINAFSQLPGVVEVIVAGDTKGSARFELPGGQFVNVDLRVVPDESFGAAWQYFTGSKEHNIRLRERAVKRGWTLNEYGLLEGERVIACRTEEEIYAALDLPWIPPEIREDRGEFEPGAVPDRLVEQGDIRGDLHVHTVASDGHNTIEEMAAAARARGYDYIGITEHSKSSAIAGGLKPDELRAHITAVRAAAQRSGMTILAGSEVDILADGALDYDDELLAALDFVVASVHSGLSGDIDANTRRVLAAVRHPYVTWIAHPTGRLINDREAMPLDIEAVVREAARTGTALELNANAWRLDLKDQHVRLARDHGVPIVICTDAHATDQFDQMRFGISTARRGWLRPEDVLNTRAADEVLAFARRKRTISK